MVAVGEAGVTVRVDEDGASAREHLPVDVALHGLHLRADGGGQAVGDGGTVLFTEDSGRSWSRVDVGTDSTLRGVDDFHFGHHL